MPLGPGKYDELCTKVREETNADTVLVIVLGGVKGSGFSMQTREMKISVLVPAILRDTADQIEASLKTGKI
jgi:hypothetical protein